MSKNRKENKIKLEEIYNRLDDKAKILYLAYKNGRLDINNLNDDMKDRILKLKEEEKKLKGNNKMIDRTKIEKIKNVKNAIDNLNVFLSNDEEDENDEEDDISEKIIIKFNDFKDI
jgi:hypothetical protein